MQILRRDSTIVAFGTFSTAWRNWGTFILFGIWAVGLSFISTLLMSIHWVPFRTPSASQALEITRESKRFSNPLGCWTAIHVIYVNCGCSNRVLDELLNSGTKPGLLERIVIVGPKDESLGRLLTEKGYQVEFISENQLLSKYGLEAAPVLAVIAPSGIVRYLGGYTNRKQSLDIRASDLIERLQAGEDIEPLPVYGCAVSDLLKKKSDPTGIKRVLLKLDNSNR